MSSKFSFKQFIPHLLVIASILSSYFIFHDESLLTPTVFIALVPIFSILKFDGRILVGYGILMFMLVVIFLCASNDYSSTKTFTIYAYWLLVTGVVCLVIEYLREERKREKENSI